MKIVFLINSLTSGGAENVVVTIVSKLLQENHDVELICLEKNNFYAIPEGLKVTYLTENDGKSSGLKKLFLIPYLAYKLKRYSQENKIDVIHSHLYRANYINVLSTLFGASHTTQIVNHGIISRYKTKGLLGKINLFLIKHLYSKANLIILISKMMKKDLNDLFDFSNKQIVINNPYDINKINKLKDEPIEDFHFLPTKKYLITMGRLISLKRYQDVLKALSMLDDNIELVLLGDGEERDNLVSLSKTLNINKRVHFLGNILNPFKYLAKADVFILSSETEGFPNSIIEALACKTVVVSSDCISGPREILAPSTSISLQLKDEIEVTEYGVLYPVGNIKLLRKAIKHLINVESSEKLLSRAKDFSVEKIITQYKKVLEIE